MSINQITKEECMLLTSSMYVSPTVLANKENLFAESIDDLLSEKDYRKRNQF